MSDAFELTVHESQWPASLALQLQEALSARRIPPKFLYESPRQVRHWLRLHELCSPARTDAGCQQTYQRCFEVVAAEMSGSEVEVLALGCGGGQKEVALVQALERHNECVQLVPCDVSTGLVITAMQHAASVLKHPPRRGVVCDLARAADWSELAGGAGGQRIVTFFGLIPNFEPHETQAILRTLLRPGDLLACSANLAPDPDSRSGVGAILPQYDNEPTRRWLGVFIEDLGIAPSDGRLQFRVEESASAPGVCRIVADFEFARDVKVEVHGRTVSFGTRERLRLFASHRHTPSTVRVLLSPLKLGAAGEWLSPEGNEGVWLFRHG